MKRDDLTSVSFGGSKLRKLEVLVAEAIEAKADVLVGVGGMQSNCTRVVAQVAAMLNLDCVVVANGCKPPSPTGNLLLTELMGARVEFVAQREDREARIGAVVAELRSKGRRPFVIPLSAATSSSALAMAAAMLEVLDCQVCPDIVIVCSSSGATQAGLLLAAALRRQRTRILGVSPDDGAAEVRERTETFIKSMMELLSVDRDGLPEIVIEVDDTFVGGNPLGSTAVGKDAVEILARCEGLLVDPIYTGRAAAAMLDALRYKRFPGAESILFWHTGGVAGVFRANG